MEEPLDEAENTLFKLQLGGEVSIKELLRPSDTFVEQHWGMGGIGNKSSENYEGWAVDINEYACESLKLNHPETQNLMKKLMMKSQKISLSLRSFRWKGLFLFAMAIPMKQRHQDCTLKCNGRAMVLVMIHGSQ
ncbi:unnamed protein product [Trifolium pratense]|uniref:Uncharacterized protein n=1 Tax=Trifolium pratense TaxID=57577 RepID=A0ACB0IW88_TRIPR|nr:unnamed protein product [Trifolium pratense]